MTMYIIFTWNPVDGVKGHVYDNFELFYTFEEAFMRAEEKQLSKPWWIAKVESDIPCDE